jgi:hypothetical protein
MRGVPGAIPGVKVVEGVEVEEMGGLSVIAGEPGGGGVVELGIEVPSFGLHSSGCLLANLIAISVF